MASGRVYEYGGSMAIKEYPADDAVLLMVLETVIKALNPVRPIHFQVSYDEQGWSVKGAEAPFDFSIWQIEDGMGFRRQGYSSSGRRLPKRRDDAGATAHQDFEAKLAEFLAAPWSRRTPLEPAPAPLEALGASDELLIEVIGNLVEPLLRSCESSTIVRYPDSMTTAWVLKAAQQAGADHEISLQGEELVVTRSEDGWLLRDRPAKPTARDDRRLGTDSPKTMKELVGVVTSPLR